MSSRTNFFTLEKLGCFLVTEDALPHAGQPLDARHFAVGQHVTATGKTIDWGFQVNNVYFIQLDINGKIVKILRISKSISISMYCFREVCIDGECVDNLPDEQPSRIEESVQWDL